MINFFYSDDGGEPLIPAPAIPENLHALLFKPVRPTFTTGIYGNFLLQEIAHQQYGICVTDFYVEKPVTLLARGAQPVVAFVLIVSGNFICRPGDAGSTIMQESHCYAIRLSQESGTTVRLSRGHHRAVFFMLTDHWFTAQARKSEIVNVLRQTIAHDLTHDPQKLEVPFSLRTKAILYDIENSPFNDEPLATNQQDEYMQSCIVEFLEDYARIHDQPPEARVHYGVLLKTFAERLLQIRSLIDEHHGRPMTIEQLAKKFGLNTRQLKTGFREMFNVTIGRYQLQRRMERAALLLVQTSKPIELICDMVGYDDRSSFTRRFKPIFKMTPLQYRIMHKEATHRNK